jgi:tetratricopeptide (TPR) repeat protein
MSRRASPQFLSTLGRTLEEGIALQRQGKLTEAERIYTRILKTLPDQQDALQLLAELKMQLGKPGEAFRLLSAAVRLRPESAETHVSLGHVLRALRRDEDALSAFEKACALAPDDLLALGARVDTLLALGRSADARECAETILALAPQNEAGRPHRASALAVLGRNDEALAEFDAVAGTAPNPALDYNRGMVLSALRRDREAVEAYDRTVALIPSHTAAWNSRGVSLQVLGRHAEAIESFDRALALAPHFARAHVNKSLSLLAAGDYPQGFAEYEWRWRRASADQKPAGFRSPAWLGETSLRNKHLFLHAEQGLGDTIQFARYIPRIVDMGAKVTVEVQPALKSLLSRLDRRASMIVRGEKRPAFDLHCPFGSLPLAFKTELRSVPSEIPYIYPDAKRMERWAARLHALEGPRVAIAWAGNPNQNNDWNRSIPLAKLAPLWAHGGARFVSVQRDLRDGDRELLATAPVLHLGAELDDLDDTAAILSHCDLVIAVDTSVSNLAGALGRPLWVPLAFFADWRWGAGDQPSPWYPPARLYRQVEPGNWDGVIARVKRDLAVTFPFHGSMG